jgi:hypothetical protein
MFKDSVLSTVTPRLRTLSDTTIESVPSATTLIGPSVLWRALVPMTIASDLSGFSDRPFNANHSLYSRSVTRGNGHKLNHGSFKHDLRKYHFSYRIVNLWNSLPNCVVEMDSVNAFKESLDTFWNSQDVFYDWEADFKTGTGLLVT